jgi:branched-subunit amino acid ABC-type transport system permease component
MEYFVQQLINGITLGSIYGLIAIGYTMVYGIIGMINFAHGDIFMVGAFLALIAFLVLVAIGVSAVPLALFIVLLVSMALTALYGPSSASPTGRCGTRFGWRRSSPRSACRSCCRTTYRSPRARG